ncbi:MAG: FkbM family methyltransferase, partial [Myxococcota bacterium]
MYRSLIGPGSIVLDVGANYGFYSTLFACLSGSRGRVHAFEPVRSTRQELESNLLLNRLSSRVQVHDFGLGNSNEVVSFESGESHSLARRGSGNIEAIIRRFDDVEDLPHHVDFIKVDVEGDELRVLEGARLMIQRCRPRIAVEINYESARNAGHSVAAIATTLREDFGYSIYSWRKDSWCEVIDDRFLSHGEMVVASDGVPIRPPVDLGSSGVENGFTVAPLETCPVCSHDSRTLVVSLYDDRYGFRGCFDVVRCGFCGSGYLAESISAEEMPELYERYYGHRTA